MLIRAVVKVTPPPINLPAACARQCRVGVNTVYQPTKAQDLPKPARGTGTLDKVKQALSWLIVAAIGLGPILVFWVAKMVERAVHKRRGQPEDSPAPAFK